MGVRSRSACFGTCSRIAASHERWVGTAANTSTTPRVQGEISSAYVHRGTGRLGVRGWVVSGDLADRVEIFADHRHLGTAPLNLRRREAEVATGRRDRAPGFRLLHDLAEDVGEGRLPHTLRALAMAGDEAVAEFELHLTAADVGDSIPALLEYEVERYEPEPEGEVYAQIDTFMRETPYFERWRGYVQTHLERFNRTFATLEGVGPLLHDVPGDVIDLAGAPYLLPALSSAFPGRSAVCMGADSRRSSYGCGRTVPIGDLDREDVDWPDESAAMVTFLEVIEHLHRDPMRSLCEINRLLVPGGLVLITTPNITSTLALTKLLRGESPNVWRQYQPFGGRRHVNEFAPDDLRCLMEAAGFDARIWSENCYIDDVDPAFERVLETWGAPADTRGDTLFAIGRKVSGVRDRYPAPMYCPDDVRRGLQRS